MSLQPGATLGPYVVTAKVGEGGMGEAFGMVGSSRMNPTRSPRNVSRELAALAAGESMLGIDAQRLPTN